MMETERYRAGCVGLSKLQRLERVNVLPQSSRDGGAGEQKICILGGADGHIVEHHDGILNECI